MIYVSLLEECQDCYLTQTSCPVKQNSDRYNSFEFLICSTFLLNEIKQGCKIGKAKVKKKMDESSTKNFRKYIERLENGIQEFMLLRAVPPSQVTGEGFR